MQAHSEKEHSMARNVSMSFNWQGPMDYAQACTRVRLAEEAGSRPYGSLRPGVAIVSRY